MAQQVPAMCLLAWQAHSCMQACSCGISHVRQPSAPADCQTKDSFPAAAGSTAGHGRDVSAVQTLSIRPVLLLKTAACHCHCRRPQQKYTDGARPGWLWSGTHVQALKPGVVVKYFRGQGPCHFIG